MTGTPRGALLVGSVPLEDTEAVMRAAGGALRDRLLRVPDGEPGERDTWIVFQAGVFDRHPDVERVPRPDEGYGDVIPVFRLRAGVDPATIDLTPLGYADAAEQSYAVFRRLRSEGVLAPDSRFQVCLPTPTACVATFIEPAQQAAAEPVYTAALVAELNRIQDTIPHTDLAIQWDLAIEPGIWEGVGGMFTAWFSPIREGSMDRAARVMNEVRAGVELGIHLCYGDFGHQHYLQPRDTELLTELANGLVDRVTRPIDWLHLPVPHDRDDADYFEPLVKLRLPAETQLYLGLIHPDGTEANERRIAAAAAVRTGFGVATECGMGRTPKEQLDGLLRQHAEVAAPW